MSNADSHKRISLQGVVAASDWDEDGSVIDIVIEATDEAKYHVAKNHKKPKLLKLIQHPVKVEGTVCEDERGQRSIQVIRFEEIEEYNQ